MLSAESGSMQLDSTWLRESKAKSISRILMSKPYIADWSEIGPESVVVPSW